MKKDEVLQFIKKYKKFVIIMHQKPDGDCIGASLATSLALRQMDKAAEIVLLDKLPEKYKFLPAAEEIREIRDIDKFFDQNKFDAVVFIDCGSLALSGADKNQFRNLPSLNIDHHATNEGYGDVNLIEAQKAATSEILYDKFLSWGIKINKDIAILLFAGIFTDTGGFQHSNTSLSVLEKASELLRRGVKVDKLSKKLFNTRSIASLKILGLALKRASHNKKYNIVYSVITEKDKDKYKVTEEDIEGVVNLIASSSGVAASLLLYETRGKVKGSLRTDRNDIDVSALAKVLGGGGHKKASGFKVPGRLKKDGSWYITG